MRRAKKVAVPEEEEEEMDFDEEMDEMDDEMAGMTLEDLLSSEEIQALTELITAVLANDLEQCKTLLARTFFSPYLEVPERLRKSRQRPKRCGSLFGLCRSWRVALSGVSSSQRWWRVRGMS